MDSNVVRFVPRTERDKRRQTADGIYLSLRDMETRALAAGWGCPGRC